MVIWISMTFALNALIRHIVLQSPDKPSHPYSAVAFGLPTPLEQVIKGSARVWTFKSTSKRVLHFFHGNGAHPLNALWHLGEIYRVCDCTIVVFSYMSLGHSEAQTSQALEAYVEKCIAHDPRHHWLFGMSLGTNAAIRASLMTSNIRGIILENPFTMFADFMPTVVSVLVRDGLLPVDNWNSLQLAAKIDKPVLVLSSEQDQVVPAWQHLNVFDALRTSKRHFVSLKGASHGDALSHPDHLLSLIEFIRENE